MNAALAFVGFLFFGFVAISVLNDGAMSSCMTNHSFDTCFQEINR